MKNIVLLLLLVIFSENIFSQDKALPKNQMVSIQYEYEWKNEDFLIVNYRMPNDYCPYENYSGLDKSYLWIKKSIYDRVTVKNYRNIFVYADKLAAKKILDFKTHYNDIGRYFLKTFFDKKGSCYGVLVINKEGKYNYIIGEYSHIDIQNLIDSLK
ncbi:hypothetical protein [Flavobacterium sp.]|uniref:hypothetical protein n=1 Tax=Flavobacterium sp. TaxID=239 RepID=UPI003D27E970